MREVVIARYGEVGVKGSATRRFMEKLLVDAIKEALERYNVNGRVEKKNARIYVWEPSNIEDSVRAVTHVFGVKSASPAYHIKFNSIDDLVDQAVLIFSDLVKGRRFKVEARRVGVHSFTSLDVEKTLGAALLEAGAGKVDLENPEVTAYVEIRDENAFFTIG